jgi:sec-independent protein translocase protein TatB
MFDIGWTELVLIAVVAVVVIGPKDLPRAMRFVGQWTGKLKRMSREFQNQFNEALRESELDSVKKDIEQITRSDPLADVRKESDRINAEIRERLAMKAKTPPAATGATGNGAASATPAAIPAPEPLIDPAIEPIADPAAPKVEP